MVGKQEQRLIDIGNAREWDIPELDRLLASMHPLTDGMVHVSQNVGVGGASGDAAIDKFVALRNYFIEVTKELELIRTTIDDANRFRRDALVKRQQLPSTTVPPEIHAAVVAGGFIAVPFWGAVGAELAVQKYEEYLRMQREEKAVDALEALERDHQARTRNFCARGYT